MWRYLLSIIYIYNNIDYINLHWSTKSIIIDNNNNNYNIEYNKHENWYLQVAVNPELKLGEMSFDNNAAICKLLYTGTFAKVHSCIMGRP